MSTPVPTQRVDPADPTSLCEWAVAYPCERADVSAVHKQRLVMGGWKHLYRHWLRLSSPMFNPGDRQQHLRCVISEPAIGTCERVTLTLTCSRVGTACPCTARPSTAVWLPLQELQCGSCVYGTRVVWGITHGDRGAVCVCL